MTVLFAIALAVACGGKSADATAGGQSPPPAATDGVGPSAARAAAAEAEAAAEAAAETAAETAAEAAAQAAVAAAAAQHAGAGAPGPGDAGPSDDATRALYKALSVRDPVPECPELEALVPGDPVGAFVVLVDQAPQPPWVGMRALRCLMVGHGESARPHLLRWVGGADTKGYALAILTDIDLLPTSVGVDVARAALAGPYADAAAQRLAHSQKPEIAGLAPREGGSP